MTDFEERFCRVVFEHADKLSSEFWQLFWPWYTSVNLRDNKKICAKGAKGTTYE